MKTDDYGSIRISMRASVLTFTCIPASHKSGSYIIISLYLVLKSNGLYTLTLFKVITRQDYNYYI